MSHDVQPEVGESGSNQPNSCPADWDLQALVVVVFSNPKSRIKRCVQLIPMQDRPLLVMSDIREAREGQGFNGSNQFKHIFNRKRLF